MNENRVREFREKAGMSQVELARRARVASTNLSSIECGRLAPWPKVKRALARRLKCSQAELFPKEAAAKLGISKNLAYELARCGKLPGVIKLGEKRIVVSRAQLERLLLGNSEARND